MERFNFGPLLEGVGNQQSLYSGSELDLYGRLIQYFGVTAAAGGRPLDLINFNRSLFTQAPTLVDVEALFNPEHGYGSPDGAAELSGLLTEFVRFRTRRYLRSIGRASDWVDSLPLHGALGTGTTGVVGCLLPALRDLSSQAGDKRNRILIVTPQYSVYDGIARQWGLEVEQVLTLADEHFLPSADRLREPIRARPLALLLTFPSNPAQTTYDADSCRQLEEIVRLCQESDTFLVVDNIYEDTLWSPGSINPEVFALGEGTRNLVKVTGPSKDRPGASGLRVGYWVGDPRIAEFYLYYASLHSNTPNSASRCWLALDLLLRRARLEQRRITELDVELLGDGVAGWSRPLDHVRLIDAIRAASLEGRYERAVGEAERRQRASLERLAARARKLDAFAEVVNGNIGNLLLIRTDPRAFKADCHELFMYLMDRVRVGVLPGNAFGLPRVPGQAWFRITTIHESVDELESRLVEIARALSRFTP